MTATSESVVVTAVFVPREGQGEGVLAALRRAIPRIHEEEGCQLYCIQAQDDGTIVMIENWDSAALLDAHGAGEPVADLNADLDGLLAAPVAVTRLTAIPIGDTLKGAL